MLICDVCERRDGEGLIQRFVLCYGTQCKPADVYLGTKLRVIDRWVVCDVMSSGCVATQEGSAL